jgi:RNA polymerase sigma factor (sigma-70 family)
VITELPARVPLWRLHRRMLPSCAFVSSPADSLPGGGRFGPTSEDPYPYLHVGLSAQATLAASLLGGLPSTGEDGYRLLTWESISGRNLSRVEAAAPLKLVSLLTASDLAAAGQDAWLVAAGASHFPQTRAWARYLRAAAPDAQGIIWRSGTRPPDGSDDRIVILFGDRLDQRVIQLTSSTTALDTAEGIQRLNEYLAPWRIILRPSEFPWPAERAQDSPTLPAERDGTALPDFEAFYRGAFRDIRKMVYAATLDMDLATEATAEALVIAWRKWEQVAGMDKAVSYVAVIACNIARRARRKLASQGDAVSLDANPEIQLRSGASPSPDDLASRAALEWALRAIPAAQAECFLLHYLCGYTIREIAASQGVPEGTVKFRLHAARKAMRELIGNDFSEGGLR